MVDMGFDHIDISRSNYIEQNYFAPWIKKATQGTSYVALSRSTRLSNVGVAGGMERNRLKKKYV